MSKYPWQETRVELPPEGLLVDTKIDDERGVRNESPLTFKRNLWWTDTMYVYYRPTHWRLREEAEG